MSFTKKTWKNKGEVGYEDSKVNASNLNDLENRVEESFEELENDSGWVSINDCLKTDFFAVRPGYDLQARRIGNLVQLRGRFYCHTAPDTNELHVLENLPEQFRTTREINSCGEMWGTFKTYTIYTINDYINLSQSDYISAVSSNESFKSYSLDQLIYFV